MPKKSPKNNTKCDFPVSKSYKIARIFCVIYVNHRPLYIIDFPFCEHIDYAL